LKRLPELRLPKPGVLKRLLAAAGLLVATFCCVRPGDDTAEAICVPLPLAPANWGPDPALPTKLKGPGREQAHRL
jgi:hypothetical protein